MPTPIVQCNGGTGECAKINSGTRKWLSQFYTDILHTSNLPKMFKKAKVIAQLKPGKAVHYRPISTCIFKNTKGTSRRIQPAINKIVPVEQSGFRENHGCVEQVMALATFIKNGYQNKLKTNVAFMDLSAA